MAVSDGDPPRETLTQAWDQRAHLLSATAVDPVANVFAQLRGIAAAGFPPRAAVFVPRVRAVHQRAGT